MDQRIISRFATSLENTIRKSAVARQTSRSAHVSEKRALMSKCGIVARFCLMICTSRLFANSSAQNLTFRRRAAKPFLFVALRALALALELLVLGRALVIAVIEAVQEPRHLQLSEQPQNG